MIEADDKAAKLVKALTYQSFQYASPIIPKVADTVKPIDDATRWGFSHEVGPFEMWDMLGVKETAKKMKAEGYMPGKWVSDMLKGGVESFYQYKNGEKVGVYDAVRGKYVKLKKPEGAMMLKGQKVEYRKNKATFHASPPASGSPSLARVPSGSSPQLPPRQRLVSSEGGLPGSARRATCAARQAAGAGLFHWAANVWDGCPGTVATL
jgi:hypothetical protein